MLRRLRTALISAALVLPLPAGVAAPAAAATAATPADPQATPAASQELNWLAQLPNRADHRVLSGFFGGYSGSTFSADEKVASQLSTVRSTTGQTPGLVACDYGAGSTIDTSCNAGLIDWARQGGLVSVSFHAPNPARPVGGLYVHLNDFSQLTDPTTAVGKQWRATLDQVAAGLQQLAAQNVPVLFRPLHEMNSTYQQAFWWSGQQHADFVAVWRNMYTYLTQSKGLHNLIWVYSALCDTPDPAGYYPGAAYADVVGLDCYASDPAAAQGYDALTALGKPFAFAEIGAPTDNNLNPPAADKNTFDFGQWATAIHHRYPATTYFLSWNDSWGLADQTPAGATALMNDPWTVNLGNVDLAATPTAAAGPPAPADPVDLLSGFETGTEGWTAYQQLNGPWQVNEWASQGTHSLKADVNLSAQRQVFLNRTAKTDLSAYASISAAARTAPWGNQAGGTTAKLYVRTGPTGAWYDSGATAVGSNGAMLTLPLAGIPDLSDVTEIGVDFTPAPGATGQSSVYVDDVTAARPTALLEDFETGTDGWTAYQQLNGPWQVKEWASHGSYSLKADVMLDQQKEAVLNRNYGGARTDLSGRLTLAADARTAPWGNQAGGTLAKLYIRTGPNCAWYDDRGQFVDSNGTRLFLNLAGVPDLDQVCELGVDFVPAPGATGQSSVYVDDVTVR
ncbi:glycosyl hydrolase [Kitasatospora humi]|uniref:glycosyl hydrolase n=1 Tax=Kitasatospora humi TaxID=2893891 RepID=UPI0024BFC436|nr:glycosyl hydrolase [Kitasatospora humi]